MGRSIRILSGLFLLIFVLIYPVSAFTTIESADTVLINEVIEDDILVAGNNVIIEGTVVGDVVVAGGTVEVRGNITQDLIVAAGEVSITGNIGDDVRAASGTLVIDGDVRDDLILFSGETTISDTGTVGGDITSTTGQLNIFGDVGGDISGSGGEVTIGGTVDGDVDVNTGELTVLQGAYISGNLKYTSPSSSEIPDGAVGKDVVFTEEAAYEDDDEGVVSSIILWLISYLSLVLIGLLGLVIWPQQLRKIAERTPEAPGKAFFTGIGIFIAGILIILFLFITVIGIPLGLILLIIVLTGLYIARVIAAIWLGKYLFRQMGKEYRPLTDLAFGLLVIMLASEIPVMGSLIYVAVTFIPVGNMYYFLRK